MDMIDILLEAESEANKEDKHFKLAPLDVEKFVKANNVQEITNPMFFIKDNAPTSDGLLSNEIFGITKDERANIFGYIDLQDWFMHPLIYKLWSRMDHRIKEIVHGTKKYIVNAHGDFEEDENGECGVSFIRKNIDKIRIRSTESRKRDKKIQYIEKYKDFIFMKKYIVIPPYYRDIQRRSGNVGVGVLNKYYSTLLVSVRSLKETQDYGLSMSNATKGRIQETIVAIYDYLCTGATSGSEPDDVGLAKKKGIIRNTVMSKTSDYGSRLVISAPELKVESLDDMITDIDHAALPLASACANFYPFMIYWVKRFFENEFGGETSHQIIGKNGKVEYAEVKNPLETFSEDAIKLQIKRFILGYSDRLSPVEVPLTNGKTAYMIFKGHNVEGIDVANKSAIGASPLISRKLTWCDVLYMAAVEVVRDKHIIITRYPVDSAYNQVPTKVRISTIKKTEQIYINGFYYRFYPYIREKDIGCNTSNMFIDTLQMSNLFLNGMGGDYDGDQVGVRGVYTIEANEEIENLLNSKKFYLNLTGINNRVSTIEAIQSIFSLTRVLPETANKLTYPKY